MKYGLHWCTWASDYFPKGLRACMEDAKRLGAEAFEVRPPDYVLANDSRAIGEARRWLDDLGMDLLFSFRFPDGMDMASEDSLVREQAVEYLKRGVEGAGAIGAKSISGIIYSVWPYPFAGDMIYPETKRERTLRSVECMRKVVKTAEDCGVMLNVEILNRFEHYMLNTVDEALDYCRRVDSPNLGILFDTFHLSMEEDSLEDAIVRAGERIGYVHVCEPNRKIPTANGRIDWSGIGRALGKAGYRGTVTLESFLLFDGEFSYNARMWRDLVDDRSLDHRYQLMRDGLAFIREQFKG